MRDLKLSIIIPAYNVEDFLGKCLDSVLCPIDGYEIIVVNDGSTDGTGAVAEAYRERYPERISVISTANGGLGAARNVAIDAARGEYLLFLDSDDTLAEGALEELFARLDEDFDMCVFAMRSVNERGEEVNHINTCTKEGRFDLASYPQLLLTAHSACNKLYRRSLFTDTGIRYPARAWYEDMRTTPKLYLYAKVIVTDPRAWYVYLQRSGSITNNANLERNLEIIDAVEDLTSYYRACGQYERYRRELEYSAFYHELLTASVRVCLTDAHSPVLDRLRSDYLARFPDYRSNPYIAALPLKHRLLSSLLLRRRTGAVALLMRLNNRIRRKEL